MSVDEIRDAMIGASLSDLKRWLKENERRVRELRRSAPLSRDMKGELAVRWQIIGPELRKHGYDIAIPFDGTVVKIGAGA